MKKHFKELRQQWEAWGRMKKHFKGVRQRGAAWGRMRKHFNPLVPVVDKSTTFILVFYKLLKYLKAHQRLHLFTR